MRSFRLAKVMCSRVRTLTDQHMLRKKKSVSAASGAGRVDPRQDPNSVSAPDSGSMAQ